MGNEKKRKKMKMRRRRRKQNDELFFTKNISRKRISQGVCVLFL
jgi:hypothetical protein